MEGKIVYFEKPGRENTEATLSIAKERAEELGIKTVLVASSSGDTGARAVEVFEGMKVIAFRGTPQGRGPNFRQFNEENRQKIESKGGIVLTARHALSGLTREGPANETGAIVMRTLAIIGSGVKVVCKIAPATADAGLVRTDEDIIVIAGTGGGADTAVVLKPVYSQDFFSLRFKEILCMPRLAVTPQREPVAVGERQRP